MSKSINSMLPSEMCSEQNLGSFTQCSKLDVYSCHQTNDLLCSCHLVALCQIQYRQQSTTTGAKSGIFVYYWNNPNYSTAAMEIIVELVPLTVFIQQEAISACYRLRLNNQWVYTNCSHTLIQDWLNNQISVARYRCD